MKTQQPQKIQRAACRYWFQTEQVPSKGGVLYGQLWNDGKRYAIGTFTIENDSVCVQFGYDERGRYAQSAAEAASVKLEVASDGSLVAVPKGSR